MWLPRLKLFPHAAAFLLRSLTALTILLAGSNVGLADCFPQEQIRGVSPNGAYELVIERVPTERFTLREHGKVVTAGSFESSGHHLTAFIDDTGSFLVLHDAYEGLAVYDSHGQRLGSFTPDDLLSIRERWTRPGRWACHPEGRWAHEYRQLSFVRAGAAIAFATHSGRTIAIDLRSAQIEHADPDRLQLALLAVLPIMFLGAVWLWRDRKRVSAQSQHEKDADRQLP